MIAGLEPYLEYKDSGVPWLEQIPGHWEVRRNGRLFSDRKEAGFPDLPILEVSLKTGVRVRDFSQNSRKQIMSDRAKYKRALRGDITYNMMRLWQGAVGTAPQDGLVSPAYVVAKPHGGIDGRYYAHLFRTDAYMREVNKYSHGIVTDRNRLYWDEFKQMPSPFPPPDEQLAIVRFLAAVQERVRRAVNAKTTLIKLLNEVKQVIVHRVVTRGTGLHRVLRPSGVPWLGEIPEHWDIVPLKVVCQIQSGVTLGKVYLSGSEYPYLRVANVQAGRLNLTKIKTLRLPPTEAQRCMLQRGDVLMTEGGDPDKLGRGCVWEEPFSPCLHQNHVFAVRPHKERLLPDFLAAVLSAWYARTYFQQTSKQTTNLASTNQNTIGSLRLPLPAVGEQAVILSSLTEELRSVEKSIKQSEREIQLTREYQTRLISDIVTGRLDVRGAAEALPLGLVEREATPESDTADEVEDVLEEVLEDA